MNIRTAASPPRYVKLPDGRWIKEDDMDESTSNETEVIIETEEPIEEEPGEDEPGDKMEDEP